MSTVQVEKAEVYQLKHFFFQEMLKEWQQKPIFLNQ